MEKSNQNHSQKEERTKEENTFYPKDLNNNYFLSSRAFFESVAEPQNEFNSKKHNREKWDKKNFPIHVFPRVIQNLALEANQKLNFPIDFSCSSSLYALSLAIGNNYHVELKEGFTQNASLFLVMIARAGSIKSHPLKLFIKPLKKLDTESFDNYKKEMDQFEVEADKPYEERDKTLAKPIFKQRILDDFTLEALIKAHKLNPKGLGLHIDEFTSWIERFDRYNGAGQEQYFLSIWNGDPITVNRVGDGFTQINKTFVSIAGTSQTRIIGRALKNKIDSGLLDRVLICQPKFTKKHAWNRLKMSPSIFEDYEEFLLEIASEEPNLSVDSSVVPELIQFTPEALAKAIEWNVRFTEEANEEKLDQKKQLYSKFDLYFLRFCLILQVSKFYATETESLEIESETVEDAIDLVDYFKTNGENFRSSFYNSDDPLSNLNEIKRTLYESLNKNFQTGEAVEQGKSLGYSKRSVNSFLNNKTLFKRIKHGFYEKKID